MFAFAEVVLAEVLVDIVFGSGFRGSWNLFGFVSAERCGERQVVQVDGIRRWVYTVFMVFTAYSGCGGI